MKLFTRRLCSYEKLTAKVQLLYEEYGAAKREWAQDRMDQRRALAEAQVWFSFQPAELADMLD